MSEGKNAYAELLMAFKKWRISGITENGCQ
jgi:hypothetical protein